MVSTRVRCHGSCVSLGGAKEIAEATAAEMPAPGGRPAEKDMQELMAAINNSHSNIKDLALAAPDVTLAAKPLTASPVLRRMCLSQNAMIG